MIIVQLNSEQLSYLIQSSIRTVLKENTSEFSNHVIKQERLLTIHEASEFLNLTVATIYCKVSKRELPFMKRSKRLYFSSSELLEYLKQGREKSNSEIEAEAKEFLLNNKKGLNHGE